MRVVVRPVALNRLHFLASFCQKWWWQITVHWRGSTHKSLHCRPREGGDPYAVNSRLRSALSPFVPATAGTQSFYLHREAGGLGPGFPPPRERTEFAALPRLISSLHARSSHLFTNVKQRNAIKRKKAN